MDYVEDKYIRLISSRLDRYKHVKRGLYNFRCPYCGDSQKNKSKARGYFFLKKSEYIYKCHNCGVGRSLGNFLKDQAPDVYDQFIMEKYKSGMTGKGRHTPSPKIPSAKPNFKKNPSAQRISDLNTSHPAKKYLLDRKIPEAQLSRFYYVDKFMSWVNTHKKTFEKITHDKPRIIIPLISDDGTWFGVQGRSLEKYTDLRYITVMFDDQLKLFGQDKIEKNETVYVTEGPFDSCFLPNAIAMCGSDVDHRNLQYDLRIWVFDNEPRNKQIVQRMQSCIESNESLVIWPKNLRLKDINDMVLAGENPYAIIKSNTYSGLEAQIKFTDWKKV